MLAASNTGNFTFGDTFAVIRNAPEFVRRVSSAAQAIGQEARCSLVEYIDNSHHGEVGAFRKSSAFEYQSEFRVAIFPGFGRAHVLEIGDISDIASGHSVAELAGGTLPDA